MRNENQAHGCPPEVLDWIAWYPEGGVPDTVRGRIEAHAAECTACRQEISLLSGDAAELEAPLPDADAVFQRVLAGIEEEAHVPSVLPLRPVATPPRRARWHESRSALLAAGIALAVVCAGIGGVAGSFWSSPEPRYQQATAAPSVGSAGGPQLQLVFEPGASMRSVQTALRGVGGTLVSGPSAGGVVHVALPAGSDAMAAAETLRAQPGLAVFVESVSR